MSENTRSQPSAEPVAKQVWQDARSAATSYWALASDRLEAADEASTAVIQAYGDARAEAARREERQLVTVELANDAAWIAATLAARAQLGEKQ